MKWKDVRIVGSMNEFGSLQLKGRRTFRAPHHNSLVQLWAHHVSTESVLWSWGFGEYTAWKKKDQRMEEEQQKHLGLLEGSEGE